MMAAAASGCAGKRGTCMTWLSCAKEEGCAKSLLLAPPAHLESCINTRASDYGDHSCLFASMVVMSCSPPALLRTRVPIVKLESSPQVALAHYSVYPQSNFAEYERRRYAIHSKNCVAFTNVDRAIVHIGWFARHVAHTILGLEQMATQCVTQWIIKGILEFL